MSRKFGWLEVFDIFVEFEGRWKAEDEVRVLTFCWMPELSTIHSTYCLYLILVKFSEQLTAGWALFDHQCFFRLSRISPA